MNYFNYHLHNYLRQSWKLIIYQVAGGTNEQHQHKMRAELKIKLLHFISFGIFGVAPPVSTSIVCFQLAEERWLVPNNIRRARSKNKFIS